eukprot:3061949-Rhodomonas_salina.1
MAGGRGAEQGRQRAEAETRGALAKCESEAKARQIAEKVVFSPNASLLGTTKHALSLVCAHTRTSDFSIQSRAHEISGCGQDAEKEAGAREEAEEATLKAVDALHNAQLLVLLLPPPPPPPPPPPSLSPPKLLLLPNSSLSSSSTSSSSSSSS